MPSNNRINFQVGFNVDQSSINAVKKSLQDLQNIRPKDFSGTKDDLNQIRQMAGKVQTALDRAFNVNLGSLNTQKFNAELSTANLSVDKIYQTFSKAGAQGQVAFSKMASSVLTTNMQLKQTRGLISQMGQTMMNTVKWGIASSVMNTFTNSVQQAFQYVKSLDSALTDIRIVTGDSTQQMAKFADQANRAASQLGRSTMDYSKAALSFYQQGLDDEAVQARTEAVLKAENITGAGDQMADYMTAVWNGYKVANEQAELYVDKLAAVADSSASNMSQLAVAMSKVASTANTMGVDVDSLNAQIATIVATTRQAPQSVGNALKTIYTRINDIATGADDAQISLGNYSEKMAEVGINVLDTNGRLRDTQDVIEQVGQKWAGMSKEQQIYLARTMAGQRQINNLTALFDNWGKYIDLVDVSMNSQGATMQKNSRYMESLEAHINQLGAANQRLKTAMIDSNSFKGLIDLGTGAVTILSNFIQSIGGGGNALLAFGSIATQVFSGTIAKQINNVVTHFQTLKNNAELVKQDIANIKLFGTSEGYQDGTIKAMVDAKTAAAQYYNFMDAAQKNQYNEIVKRVGATQDQVTLLNEKIKKANDFQNALKGQLDTTIEVKDQLQNMLNSLSSKQGGLQLLGTKDQQGNLVYLEELKTKVNQLRNTVDSSAIPGFKAFDEAISKIGQNSEITVPQLAAVRRALAQIVSETNVGIDLSLGIKELETEAKQAQASLQLAKQAAQDYLNSVKQFANIQGIVKATGALGGFASSLMAIKNLGKVWSNQTLSGGEKVLQTMISLGTAGPRLVTTFLELRKITSAWSTALDITGSIQAKNIALTNAQIIAQKAHAEVQTFETAIQNIKNNANLTDIERTTHLTIVEGKLAEARREETIAITQEKIAQEGLNKALASNPIGLAMAITAAAIFIGVKAYDALTMSAKEAEQAIEAFNQKQESLNNNLKKFNTDKTNLNIDEWEELSKRAGAYNSTINNLTEQQKTRYYELSNLIAEYNQSAVAGYDEQGNAIIETNHNLEETIQLLKQKRQLEIDNTYDSKEYKQNVRAQQVQYKDTEKEYQNRRIDNQNIDLNQQSAFNQNLDYLKQTLIDSGENYSDLINEINQIQKQGLDNFNKNKDIFIADLNKASSVVPKTAIDYFTNIGDQLKEGKKQQEEIAKELQEASKIDFSTLLGKLSTTQNKQQYQEAKQAGALSIDGLIQSYIDGLIESGQVSRAKLGQQEDIYQYIIDEFLNSSEGFLTKLNEILYTPSKDFGFDQQHSPLNLQQYILEAGNKLEDLNFSSLQQKQAVAIQKIKNIILGNKDLQEILKEDSPIRDALLELITNAFNLDGLEIDPNFENIKISNNSVDKLKHRIEQLYNEGKSDDLKIKFNIGEVEALLPDDITSGEIDALIPIFEQLYKATGDWEYSLRKAQQQLNFDSAVESISLLEAKLSGQSLNDQQLQALQNGLNEIKQLYPQIANSVDILNKQWLEGTIVYRRALQDVKLALFNSFSSVGDYTEDVKQQMASLITTTEDLEHALRTNEDLLKTADGPAWYAEQLEKIASNYESCTDQLNRYLLARQSGNLIDQQAAEFDLILATRAEENSQLYGIQAERISEVSKQFLEYAQAGREGYQGLQNNAELTTDMATRYLRLNDAVADIIDNFDKYKEVLQEASEYGTESVRANEQMSDTFANLKEDVAGLLDTSTELFGDDWVVQNMDNILEAAQGNEEALRSLQEAAGQQILINIGVDLSPLGLANEDILNWINQLPDGQIDMTLDDSQFLNQLVWAMQAAGQSQAEIESALKGLSLEVDLTPYQAGLNAAVDAAYQASDAIVSNLGFDSQAKSETQTDQDNAEIAGYLATPQPMTAPVMIPRVAQQVTPFGVLPFFSGYETGTIHFSGVRVEPQLESMDTSKTTTTTALMVKNARKKSGGNIAHSNRKVPGSGGGGRKGGGKKGGGKKATAPKPGTQAKAINNKIDTKEKQKQYNPYQQVEKSYQRQQKAIKNLQQAEKKITGKQRLKNLNAQIDALEKQNKIIEERQKISDDAASEGTTADLRKDILKDKVLGAGKNIFDEDGQLHDQTSMKNAAVDYFNDRIKIYEASYRDVEAQQEKWINDVWNKYNKDQQEKHKIQKDQSDQRVKDAKELYDKQVKQEEEAYKERIQLMNNYQKKREQDVKYQQQYFDNLRTIFDKYLQGMTLKAKIDLDAGDALRTWNQFDNRVLRQIDKNDILGNSKAKAREIKTYLDSGQIKDALNTANNLRERLANVQNGGYDIAFGMDHQAWERLNDDQKALYTQGAKEKIRAQLEDLIKNTENGLLKVQDLLDDLQEDYVDSLKQAGDRMDDLIDQYERVNSLLDHQIKVNQLLYGDQAYKYLNKFYEKQRQNNQKELADLRAQQNQWQQQLNAHQDADGNIINEEAWKEAKSNLDKVTDDMNSKLQQMMQNAAKTFENKMLKAVDDVNNRLTNGLGTKYVDEQWDQIGQFDDYFLDAVNSKFGIQEVTRAYQQAAATVNDPKQQQKINKLMNDQLKILKEKDKLTEYDIERAKASLQVEKARMALEDARNNKTKMRLRRDSQGNYTYQYVADEQKLTDLQAALADAQNNLYNQDKQHYKQNLDQLYNTYKDYIEKMTALQKEYNQTQDVQQKKRIQDRMDLLKQSAEIMMSGLTEDNKVTLGTYLRQSLFDAMDWNLEDYTDEQSLALTRQIVPWGQSEIQDLSDNIVGEGGLLNATRDFLSGLAQASQEYDAEIKSAMDTFTGVQSQDMQQAINNTNKSLDQQNQKAGALITTYQGLTEAAKESVKQVASLVEGMQQLLNSSDGFNLGQMGQSLKNLTNVNLDQMGSSARVSTPTIQQQNAKYNAVTNFNDDKNYTGDNQLYQAWINSNTNDLDKFKEQFELEKQRLRKQAERKAAEEAERRAREAEEAAFRQEQQAYKKRMQKEAAEDAARKKAIDEETAARAMEEYLQNRVNEENVKNDNNLARLGNVSEDYATKSGKAAGAGGKSSSVANTYNVDAHFPNATTGDEIVAAIMNIPNIAAQKANGTGL